MSLINEALKQAQRETHGSKAPAVRDVHVSEVAQDQGRSKAVPALVALMLVAAGGVAWFVFSKTETKPVEKAESSAPVVSSPAPVVPAKPAVTPATGPSDPAAAPGAAVPPTAPAAEVPPPPPVEEAPKPAVPAVAPEPVAPVAPEVPVQNPQLVEMISIMRLTLARKSTGRAVIDGVVVKVGEHICEQPVLILSEITDSGVIFKDAAGVSYPKRIK